MQNTWVQAMVENTQVTVFLPQRPLDMNIHLHEKLIFPIIFTLHSSVSVTQGLVIVPIFIAKGTTKILTFLSRLSTQLLYGTKAKAKKKKKKRFATNHLQSHGEPEFAK